MTNDEFGGVVEHPSAALYKRKLDREARDAQDKEERRKHRKRLRETKAERDSWKAYREKWEATEALFSNAIFDAAQAQARKSCPVSRREHVLAFHSAYHAIADEALAAAKTAAAKAAGYDSLEALKSANGWEIVEGS